MGYVLVWIYQAWVYNLLERHFLPQTTIRPSYQIWIKIFLKYWSHFCALIVYFVDKYWLQLDCGMRKLKYSMHSRIEIVFICVEPITLFLESADSWSFLVLDHPIQIRIPTIILPSWQCTLLWPMLFHHLHIGQFGRNSPCV